ncbi:hypothetical protein NYR61_08040 [Actinobacillus genomosp. 1]|uniref:hypothetical protein n=1 Tax=Actinobacillus genomosp. 1 TaxID=254839 RepID=UPI00244316FA|nr:hypothetical protein [Actinobacillus genomosp. 1]WGE33440.1 hypothetical protein NYR61_08040 [Actinobacillus genomosp. 1]
MLSRQSATQGFILAGIYNLVCILGFTQFFTDRTLMENDPIVFSWLGQIAIILWGLAYLSVARSFWKVPYLVVVFCLEKMLYAGAWLYWLATIPEKLDVLAGQSMLMFCFFASYGFGDFLFGLFFLIAAVNSFKGRYH